MRALLNKLPALAVAALLAGTAGCGIDTQVVGVIADKDLNTPELMEVLVRGHNSEVTDVWAADVSDYTYVTLSATDDFLNDGTSGSEYRYSVSQYHFRPAGSIWEQSMEASWAGIYGVNRIKEVDEEWDIDPTSDPLIARSWLNAALAERFLGEVFCELVYNFGPNGGILLPGEGRYDPSNVVPNDSAFTRAITMATTALDVAQKGVQQGVATPQDWYMFDPQELVYSAHGLLAQMYLYTEQWDLADQHASQVPIDHIEYTHFNDETERGGPFYIHHQSDDGGVWGTPAGMQWAGDPRVPFVKCGDFKPGVVPGTTNSSSNFINLTASEPECNRWGQGNEYRAESNYYPRWPQMKMPDWDSDIPMIKGTEMPLIRAEVVLRKGGSLAQFTTYINQVRAFYGLPAIAQPATAGALEYPNAEDDAWSILDRERYLTLWLEGRRYYDMRRWNHPFWTEGKYLKIQHANLNPPGPRPWLCFPIPSNECNTNPQIRQSASCGPLSPPGG